MSERREGQDQLVEDTGWLDLDHDATSVDDFAWRDRELPTIWRVTHAPFLDWGSEQICTDLQLTHRTTPSRSRALRLSLAEVCAPSSTAAVVPLQSHPAKSTTQRRGHQGTTRSGPTRQTIAAYRPTWRGQSEAYQLLLLALALQRDVRTTLAATATATAKAKTSSWTSSYATPPRSLPPQDDHVLLPNPPPPLLLLPDLDREHEQEEQAHRQSNSNKKISI